VALSKCLTSLGMQENIETLGTDMDKREEKARNVRVAVYG